MHTFFIGYTEGMPAIWSLSPAKKKPHTPAHSLRPTHTLKRYCNVISNIIRGGKSTLYK